MAVCTVQTWPPAVLDDMSPVSVVALGLPIPKAAVFIGEQRSVFADSGSCRWHLRVGRADHDCKLVARLERRCAPAPRCRCEPVVMFRVRPQRDGVKDFQWPAEHGNERFVLIDELFEPARGYVDADGEMALEADVYLNGPQAVDDDAADHFEGITTTRDAAFALAYMHSDWCRRRNRLADGSAACVSPLCIGMCRLVEHCAMCDIAPDQCPRVNCDFARSLTAHVRDSSATCQCHMCLVAETDSVSLALPTLPTPELDTALVQTDDCEQWGNRAGKRDVTSAASQTESQMEEQLAALRLHCAMHRTGVDKAAAAQTKAAGAQKEAAAAQKEAAAERELTKQLRKKLKQAEAEAKRARAACEQQTAEHNAKLERLHEQLALADDKLAECNAELERVVEQWRPPVLSADASAQVNVQCGDNATQTAAVLPPQPVPVRDVDNGRPALPVLRPPPRPPVFNSYTAAAKVSVQCGDRATQVVAEQPVLKPPPRPPVFNSYTASPSPPGSVHQQESAVPPVPFAIAIATVTLAPGVGRGRPAEAGQ